MLYRYGVRVGVMSLLRGRITREVAKNLIVPTNYWRSLEFRLAFEELHASANDRILDVGSPKLLSLYLADRIGADVYSTDIEPYFIDDYTAFRKFLKVPENRFHAMVADGRTLPFDDGYFSRIFSVSVVEHIPDHGDSECLRELARTLSRGGICVLTVPFAPESRNEYKDKDSFYWSANVTAEEPSEGTFFQRRYSERDLHTRLIEPSGLEAVKIQYLGDRVSFSDGKEFSEYLPLLLGPLHPLASRLFHAIPSLSWQHLKHPRGAMVVLRKT